MPLFTLLSMYREPSLLRLATLRSTTNFAMHVHLHVIPVAGQERYQSLGSAFYRGADACVLVYDITDLRSLDTLASWRDEFLVAAAPRDPDSFPFIVLGNKVDVTDKAREVPTRRAKTWCAAQGSLPLFETSAMDDINVEAAFDVVVRKALSRLNEEPQDLYVASFLFVARWKSFSCVA